MATDLLDISDRLLDGGLSVEDHSVAVGAPTEVLELGDGLAFVESFANVTAIEPTRPTGADRRRQRHPRPRPRSGPSLDRRAARRAVYTHGHVDHCFGVPLFEAEATALRRSRSWPTRPSPARFDRYRLTNGYNGIINQRQFRLRAPLFPEEFRYPDQTYRDDLALDVGDTAVELHHDRGETDDHTWVWLPEHAGCCAPATCSSGWHPTAATPRRSSATPSSGPPPCARWQRSAPSVLLPGSRPADPRRRERIHGARRHRRAARVGLRADARADERRRPPRRDRPHGARPGGLLERPWLQPVYDDPEFIVHNVWRLYGGWYDGNPSHLKPAPEAELALGAGPAGRWRRRARRAGRGAGRRRRLRLAGHLAELAAQAAPDDRRGARVARRGEPRAGAPSPR